MKLGPWTLVSKLGSGGNGQVWLATRSDGATAALKVLARVGGDRWQRFSDEVEVMRQLGDEPGVLPLIDAHIPAAGSRAKAWLATPRATPAAEALADASLAEVVDAAREYAGTLARLATRGIHHRDIKPDNLFALDGAWVLGDFGLAAYPGKEPLTTNARKLGPLYFIAPEMLRVPDSADAERADVYSLAKTLWVLAAGQRYPPEGQIRVDAAAYDLSQWVSGDGVLALGLILEQATSIRPDDRFTLAEFAEQLERWAQGGAVQDDAAEKVIQSRYVDALGARLAGSLDPGAIADVEKQFKDVLRQAQLESAEKQREARRAAYQASEDERLAYLRRGGAKASLSLSDTVWMGSLRDCEDFAYAILEQPEERREGELTRARQILWGRPLWWMHTAALGGTLRIRNEPECEPLATELAAQEIRYHLLEFADHPTLAAAWRLQRAIVPLTARIVAAAPLDQLSQAMSSKLSARDRLKYSLDPSRLFLFSVDEFVRRYLRQVHWTPAALTAAAEEVEQALTRVPIPTAEWAGPATDPWLTSWSEESPLITTGIWALSAYPQGDDLLTAPEIRDVISDVAANGSVTTRRSAEPLAHRLSL
jgi:hypothetical protein